VWKLRQRSPGVYSRLLSGIDVFHEGKKVRAEVHPLEYVEDF
jgi:hypothetical protein